MSKIKSSVDIQDFPLWEKIKQKNGLVSFELELTARCVNNCRHCYINLPAGDGAREKELSFEEIREIADEAARMGALWCMLTGGDPLIRPDFNDIYVYLKKKGFFLSVLTTGVLVTEEHARLFKKYPPRDVEITVYGTSKKTYERITRQPGSFDRFRRGLDLLLENGIGVRLKAMALRSNYEDMDEIAEFCRKMTKDYYRFDPLLHLRVDGRKDRNKEIVSERLTPEQIVELEKADPERARFMEQHCDRLIQPVCDPACNHLFHCGAGLGKFYVTYDGLFCLCSSLRHPDCVYDLKQGTLEDAFRNFVPKVRDMSSNRKAFMEKCRACSIVNLCLWCPAHAHLETGELDLPIDAFCKAAHVRAERLDISMNN